MRALRSTVCTGKSWTHRTAARRSSPSSRLEALPSYEAARVAPRTRLQRGAARRRLVLGGVPSKGIRSRWSSGTQALCSLTWPSHIAFSDRTALYAKPDQLTLPLLLAPLQPQRAVLFDVDRTLFAHGRAPWVWAHECPKLVAAYNARGRKIKARSPDPYGRSPHRSRGASLSPATASPERAWLGPYRHARRA